MVKQKKRNVEPHNKVDRRGFLLTTALSSAVAVTADGFANNASANTLEHEAQANIHDDVLDVVVIGAGISGLTAARDLKRADNNSFVVLEASQRVGGRVKNHKLNTGHISEAGGQWIGPGQTAIADLARELEINTFDSIYDGKVVVMMGDGKIAMQTSDEVGLKPELMSEINELANTLPQGKPWAAPRAAEWDQISLGEWLHQKDADFFEHEAWNVSSVSAAGAAPAHVSFLYFLSMIKFAQGIEVLLGQKGGAQQTRFEGGSETIPLTMAEELDEHVVLNAPVTKISKWNEGIAEVITPAGVYKTKSIILAMSPALCDQIEFEPSLPEARQQLQSLWPAHAPMCKSAMVYQKPFWRDKGYNGQVLTFDGPVVWAYDNSPANAEIGVINAFLRVGELPSDESLIKRELAEIYSKAMGDDRFLEPIDFHYHDWGKEEYSYSCVSPLAPGQLTSDYMSSLTEDIDCLIWSGTETADIWNGYMDGAVRSGRSAALKALQRAHTFDSRARES